MEDDKIRKIIERSVGDLLGTEEQVRKKLKDLLIKHKKKVHFAPIKYRVLGGFLQSLNIKFGNFLEVLLANIIKETSGLTVLMVSEKKDLALGKECERLINSHIDHRVPKEKLKKALDDLYRAIFSEEKQKINEKKLDVDLLIADTQRHYYVEVKYNDDHDTGKFEDINRKAIKTYAALANELNFKSEQDFGLIIYYFNPHKRYYPSPYLRDGVEVLRGDELFKKFNLDINYKVVEDELSRLNRKLENNFDYYTELIFKMAKNS